ncbi:hypothetical protein N798_06930 [Knoellia flava TL1]|uniref:Uncharacterized protein n=2 Tax=Knoellia flava TaxID=913969 RepID=A0A8H9FWY8_9MICO|nr:hypothetical protein N798_06930 [Knoellia flava TL1]GGB87455.1 hypothetical protein GCM10011314_29050 [Knoellia flava]
MSRGGGPRKGRYLWAAGGARLFDPTGQEHTREFTKLTTSEVEECLAELPAMQVGVIECGAGVTFFEGRARLEVWRDRIRAQLHDPKRDAPDVEWGYVAELWRDDTSGRQALIFNGE